MRQLFPTAEATVDVTERYASDDRPRPTGRPWVLLNMVASVDGATALDGRSGELSGPADKAVFAAIRSVADIIVVGAGTVRAEGYGAPTLSADQQARRVARGQVPIPRIAVITSRIDLDLGSALFSQPTSRPLVLTTADAGEPRLAQTAEVADVLICGDDDTVDLADGIAALGERHQATVVLAEGGPTLNGQLWAVGALDELCVTVSPTLAGGTSTRLMGSGGHAQPLELRRVLEQDGMLFLRYTLDRQIADRDARR